MYQKVFFIALFGIILFGLTYFFVKFYGKEKEGFQNAGSGSTYIVPSDLFPDPSIPYNSFDLSGFSMVYNIYILDQCS